MNNQAQNIDIFTSWHLATKILVFHSTKEIEEKVVPLSSWNVLG